MQFTKSSTLAALNLILAFSLISPAAQAAVANFSYTVSLSDPSNALGSNRSRFLSNLDGAMSLWKKALVMKGAMKIRVEVATTPFGTLDAASTSNTIISYNNGIPVYEEGAAYLIRTGKNLNSKNADLLIRVDPTYIRTQVWYDPRPLIRIDAIPQNKIDLVSVLTHEMAHAFGFNGFVDQRTGLTNRSYLSVFDQFLQTDSNGSRFIGLNATFSYGKAVPLTSGNLYHYGNANTPDLLSGLMNGVNFYYGRRYSISKLDIAVMKDLGQTAR